MNKIIKLNLIHFCFLLFLELVFSLMLFNYYGIQTFISSLIYILLSSCVITFLTTIFKKRINKIINYIIYFVICLWFSLQFVFKSSMHTYFSLSLFKLSDQAAQFAGETIKIILENLYGIIIFFLPFIVFILFRKKLNYDFSNNKKYLFSYIILVPLLMFCYRLFLCTEKNVSLSIYDVYYNIDNTSLSIQKLGILPSAGLDFYRTTFGFEEKTVNTFSENDDVELSIPGKNILNLDLSDERLDGTLREYIENNKGTYKNQYTGIFENKNLIFIIAESFSEVAIDRELTPTLYKLTNNGFVFNNFYVSYYLSTIGGEFQALTGLYPNTSTLGIWRNGNNIFPYGISNVFKEKGYTTYAYHAHDGKFQDRNKYIKSLGFDNFKACNMGLDINCELWPESDIEMIEKSYSDYMNSDRPFMTYYMTVSGHMNYNFNSNSMAIKNKKLVEHLSYSDSALAYLATQIELDRALELLIKKLEDNNKLDDTIIILLADHYPYELSLYEINELSSYNRDSLFEINHNSLVIWNNKLDRIEIDKVGMPIDVIPTVYNLFGINYDSRLYAGSDLLSDSEGLIILGDRSWITDKGKYSSVSNSFSGDTEKDYINRINNVVQNKIVFSKNMLLYNGYKYISEIKD